MSTTIITCPVCGEDYPDDCEHKHCDCEICRTGREVKAIVEKYKMTDSEKEVLLTNLPCCIAESEISHACFADAENLKMVIVEAATLLKSGDIVKTYNLLDNAIKESEE